MNLFGSIDGYVMARSEGAYRLDMIHVVVRDEHSANMVEVVAMFFETLANGAYANTYIDEDAVVAIAKEVTIATATAT